MAQQNSLSLLEFQKKFDTESKCQTHLFKHKWPNGYKCEKCGCTEFYLIEKRHHYQCKNCRYQASVTSGTVMHKTRVELVKWFWAIYLIAKDKRGISALALQRELKISYPTVWTMVHKIRHAMAIQDGNYQLANIVEIDEAYFGGPDKNKRGRGTSKSKVVVAVSTTDDGKPLYAKLTVVENITKQTVSNLITDNVEWCTKIKSDGLNVYKHLSDSTIYKHTQVTNDSENLPWVHKIISNAKSFILGTYHGLGKKHLQSYLSEFAYRFNRRFWQSQLFDRLLNACVLNKGLTFAELT